MNQESQKDFLMSQTLQCAALLKKARLMGNEYSRALRWIDQEIASPTPHETLSPVEKTEKLLLAKAQVEKAKQELDQELVTLERNLKSTSAGFILDIAKTLSEF